VRDPAVCEAVFWVPMLSLTAKTFKYALVGILSVSALPVIAVHVNQRIIRYRAEQLLSDIRSLQLRQTTFEQVKPILNKWERSTQYRRWQDPFDRKRECNAQNCDFTINVHDSLNPNFIYNKLHVEFWRDHWPDRIYRAIGGRNSSVAATVTVRNGVIWEKGYALLVSVPQSDRFASYELIAESYTVSRFYPGGRRWASRRLHPEYVIDGPDGCAICIQVEAKYTPYANPEDVAKLMDINLSCITRFSPCRTKADILPSAMAQEAKEARLIGVDSWQVACDEKIVETLSRDTENVVIVDVISFGETLETDEIYPYRTLTVRLVQKLKGAKTWNTGSNEQIRAYEEGLTVVGDRGNPAKVASGDRMILLFGYLRDRDVPGYQGRRRPWLETCGALQFSNENLALVKKGILQDQRPNDLN
jgi:hypothetical protein